MKKGQSIVEMILGICGIAITLGFQNKWSFTPLILWGIVSALMIRRESKNELSETERKCTKKRNIAVLICWVLAGIICYFSADGTLRCNGFWFLLSGYLFLAMHGLAFIFPIGFFQNEKNIEK